MISSKFDEMKQQVLKKFDEYTTKQGFKIKTATDGIYFSPIHEGKVLNEEEFNKLDESIKELKITNLKLLSV